MINPVCPLSDKEKLYVTLRHKCLHIFRQCPCSTNCTFHNIINSESELLQLMTNEIQKEIDSEFLRRCMND